MPDLIMSNKEGDTFRAEPLADVFHLHFTMLNGMANFSFELTNEEAIELACFIVACTLGKRAG